MQEQYMQMSDIEGLWTVEFGVPSYSTYGAGIIIFSNGGAYGGDTSYYYIGKYFIDGEIVKAQLRVKHHYGPKNNVLGSGIGEVDLNLEGKADSAKMTVTNGQFMAVLTKRENLTN
jgi:hypothetical protein